MAIIVNPGGGLGVGEPGDDPSRRRHAQMVDLLAWHLELQEQMDEAFSAKLEKLAARVAFVEALLTGRSDAA